MLCIWGGGTHNVLVGGTKGKDPKITAVKLQYNNQKKIRAEYMKETNYPKKDLKTLILYKAKKRTLKKRRKEITF